MSIYNWLEHGAPYYIGLACAAVDANLDVPTETAMDHLPAPSFADRGGSRAHGIG